MTCTSCWDSRKAEGEALSLILDTQRLAKFKQLWRKTALKAQSYSGNLKSYSYMFNIVVYYIICLFGQVAHRVHSSHVVFWLLVIANVVLCEPQNEYHCFVWKLARQLQERSPYHRELASRLWLAIAKKLRGPADMTLVAALNVLLLQVTLYVLDLEKSPI